MANVAAMAMACLQPAATALGPALAAAAATTAVVRRHLALWGLPPRRAPAAVSVAAHRGLMMILGFPLSLLFQVHLQRQRLLQRRQLLLPRLLRDQGPVRAALSAVVRTLPAMVPRRHQVLKCPYLHPFPILVLCLLPNLLACPLCLLAAMRYIGLTRVGSAWILLPILPA